MADIQITAAGRKHLSDISRNLQQMPGISTGKSILRDEQRKVLNILIASPSLVEERAIVESAIHD